MLKRITAFLASVCLMLLEMTAVGVYAEMESEKDVASRIAAVENEYIPGTTFFVSNSPDHVRMIGEDNIDGDKSKGCFEKGTDNSHGRFGGAWQSEGFAKYVYFRSFNSIPYFDHHGNPTSLDDVTIVGRYVTDIGCNRVCGQVDGEVTLENISSLMKKAKIGDLLILTPMVGCRDKATVMVVTEANDAGVYVYQADYTGHCAVTKDLVTFDALAGYHAVTLLHSRNYPMVPTDVPSAVEKITLSGDDFALNDTVSVSWTNVKWAKTYDVTLTDEQGKIIDLIENLGTTVASFSFTKAGTYRISVCAENEYGKSEAVCSDSIVVHDYVKVVFVDYDGTVIDRRRIQYGTDVDLPAVPQRKGHVFSHWSGKLTNITEPTTITAVYEPLKYSVKYYDVGGKSLLGENTVAFRNAATPPANYHLDSGYVFAGWHAVVDDSHQWTDYRSVEGDMILVATECWANENLPILITFNSAELQQDNLTYKISATLKNYDKKATSFKLIATLKTSAGKVVKSVPFKEMTFAINESRTIEEEVVYNNKISSIELVAVGISGDVKTSGAYSKLVSRGISAQTTWYWGSWSDWTESKPGGYDDYESKTQYSSSERTYTTNTSTKYLDGWTLYKTDEHTGNWSSYQNSAVSVVNTTALRRDVETQIIPATYKTQYRYGAWKKTTGGGYTRHFCYDLARSQQPGTTWVLDYTSWLDSAVPINRQNYWICAQNHSSHHGAEYIGNRYFFDEYIVNGREYYWQETREVEKTPAYTQYRYRDTTFTYYFYKWSSYSAWTDTAVSATSDRNVKTRTVYRYRKKIVNTVSDPTAGFEDTSGKAYTASGTIPAVTGNLSGKTANFMVYKKTNSDPTEAQLEYVGQIVIGSGNSYNVTFRPREEPTENTGDFVITIGVEGADNLVDVGMLKAVLPVYEVKYYDYDGTQIGETQLIEKGSAASAPELQPRTGYDFVKWSDTATNVQRNLNIYAEYKPKVFTVTFVDCDTAEIISNQCQYGELIRYPDLVAVPHVANRQWQAQLDGIETVSDNMVICSVDEYEKYSVKFSVDGEVVSCCEVEYGKPAPVPASPEAEGMVFVTWRGNCSLDAITCDAEFYPEFAFESTVSLPSAEVVSETDESRLISLSCATEGARVFYTIEEADDAEESEASLLDGLNHMMTLLGTEGESEEYGVSSGYDFLMFAEEYSGEPVELHEGQTLVFLAMADNMNTSLPCVEYIERPSYYSIRLTKNTLRQYRHTVEGALQLELSNNTPAVDLAMFAVCMYDEKGIMISRKTLKKSILAGANVIDFSDIEIPCESQSVSCKLICTLSGQSVTPMTDCLDIVVA